MMLGDTTVTTQTAGATPQGFTQGLTLWQTPGAAFSAAQSAVTNYSSSFSGSNLQYTLGLLAVPLAALVLLSSMGGRR